MPDLCTLALMFETDKGPSFHNYTRIYKHVLPLDRLRSILEIGVLDGASLRMWAKACPDAQVLGLDIHTPHVRKFNADDGFPNARAQVLDASDPKALATLNGRFDLIVDDGSHEPDHQKLAFQTLQHQLNPGGFYVIEDCEAKGGDYLDELYRYYLLPPDTRDDLRPEFARFRHPIFYCGDSGGWTAILEKL